MIQITDREGVRLVSLNRPPANNLDRSMLEDLQKAARDAAGDSAVRCVVLRSELPKYFSAGLDVEFILGADGRPRAEAFQTLLSTYRLWAELPKPTVASIGGTALLGGCILAMACDFRLIGEGGRMALSEVKLGLSPTPVLLARLESIGVRPASARELALKGRTLRAAEAADAGLADRVVPAGELEGETWSEARSLCRALPGAYAQVKKDLARASRGDYEALWKDSLEAFRSQLSSPEAAQALGQLAARVRAGAGS